MEPELQLTLTADEGAEGGTFASFVLTMTNKDGVQCSASRDVRLPMPPNFMHPWDWAQVVLCATADACDTYEGITMIHGEGCPEVPHADA